MTIEISRAEETKELEGNEMYSFVEWYPEARRFVFNILDDLAPVGDYKILITLIDESYQVANELWIYVETNTAPYFPTEEVGHIEGSMKEGSYSNIYSLNPAIDDEGD